MWHEDTCHSNLLAKQVHNHITPVYVQQADITATTI